jgi:hypothetical protein
LGDCFGDNFLISEVAYILLTQARKKTTTNIGSRRIAICNCNYNVKKGMKPPPWGGNLKNKRKHFV